MANEYVEKNDGFITRSKMTSFNFCPYRFYLEYIKKIEIPKSEALEKGIRFHEYMELGEEKFLEKHPIVATRRSNPDGTLKSHLESMRLCKAEFDRNKLSDMNSDYFKEEVIEIEISGLKFRCALDRIFHEKKCFRDWKRVGSLSRFNRFEGELFEKQNADEVEWQPDSYWNQLAFYAFLIHQKYGEWYDGILDVVDDKGHSMYFKFTADTLRDSSSPWLSILERYIKAELKKDWTPEFIIREEKCFNCPCYNYCKHATQKDFIIF